MSNTPQGAKSLEIIDRRLCGRRSVPSLAYVDLGESNGGVILNIGEGGLAVTLVAPLYTDVLSRMRFQLPGSSEWLEARGEIARIGDSKKEVGLRFVNLSEDARSRIKHWVSAVSPGQSQKATNRVSGEEAQPADLVKSATAESPGPDDAAHGEAQGSIPVAESDALSRGEDGFSDNLPQVRDPLRPSDRRVHERRSVSSLAYVDLGENNGGAILNIGEGGLALTSVAPLHTDVPARMRFQLPGSSEWIEASGEIARISESKKEAGLRFVSLSEDTRKQIKGWISSEASPDELQRDGAGAREKAWRRLEMPVWGVPPSIPSPLANRDRITRKYAEVSKSTLSATSPFVASQRIWGTTGYRRGFEVGSHSKRRALQWRTWATLAAVVLPGAFLAGWLTSDPGMMSRISARLGITRTEQSETAKGRESPASFVASVPGPSTQNELPYGTGPEPASSSTTRDFTGQPASNTPTEARSNGFAPASRSASVGSSSAGAAHSQEHVLESGAVSAAAKVVSPPKNNVPPQAAENVAPLTQETSSSKPPSPNVKQSDGARTGGTTEQESSSPSKSAEITVASKAEISVSFGLYPSIRVPAGLKSQMPQRGASLQIGQLLSRVDPVYPTEAEAQHLEGTVKLVAIIGPNGAIESVEPRSGPDLLTSAAANAVRQWRYTPSSVGGQPVEAEQDITVTFRLLEQPAHPN